MKTARRLIAGLASRLESLIRPPDDLVPPLHLRWSYYRSARPDAYWPFAEAAAAELVSRGLAPDDRVLDVGCGLGSLALGLVPHLPHGRYEGLDVHAEAVDWCQRAITRRHPRFRFRHADLFSTAYNPRGALRTSEYHFPYDAGSFDWALLSSVCTHLVAEDVAQYLREVARALRPGGRCVISFYLLTAESLAGVEAGTSSLAFIHPHGAQGSRVIDPACPELAIAHPEALIQRRYHEAGLRITDVRRGGWPGGAAHQQDVVTAVRA